MTYRAIYHVDAIEIVVVLMLTLVLGLRNESSNITKCWPGGETEKESEKGGEKRKRRRKGGDGEKMERWVRKESGELRKQWMCMYERN